MDELEELLHDTPPERIIYTTYTNAGANEAVERAVARFTQFTADNFKYFSTLHSLCYRNTRRTPMLTFPEIRHFGKKIGYAISGAGAVSARDGTAVQGVGRGDKLLAMENLRRNRKASFEEICAEEDIAKESPKTLKHFSESYEQYKNTIGKIDFADQLQNFILQGRSLDIDYLFLDEAQDLSKLQWEVVELLAAPAKHVFIAGDDKQSIYEFSGGSPESLINQVGEREVLDVCYRLPEKLLSYAEGIADRIVRKTPYTVRPTRKGGTVQHISSFRDLELAHGSWLMMARNRSYLPILEKEIQGRGFLFKSMTGDLIPTGLLDAITSWKNIIDGHYISAKEAQHLYSNYLPSGSRVSRGFKKQMVAAHDDQLFDYDTLVQNYGLICNLPWHEAFALPTNLKSYLLEAEKSGHFSDPERIEVSTIHSTKGREADNVVIIPDMAYPTYQAFQKYPDTEHRTFYVACTRARENLFILNPLGNNFYDYPKV